MPVMLEMRPSSVLLVRHQQQLGLLLFSAVVPVVEVVPAVLLVFPFPLAHRARLVLHEDALLELSVEVPAAVPPVHWDEHRV